MAIIDRNKFFNALTTSAVWNVGVPINRTGAKPLDKNSIFDTTKKAEEYAQSSTAYPGQIISVVLEDGTNEYYGISQRGTIEPIGGNTVLVDDKSIEIDENGNIKLKDFGTKYYAYTESGYVLTEVTEGGSVPDGLQPRLTVNKTTKAIELAWYEPNPTTVEGLKDSINILQAQVQTNTETLTWKGINT